MKFYICEHCGNEIMMVKDAGVAPMCCGQKMKLLEAGVVEASAEKHIPVYTVDNGVVSVAVGSAPHPMTEDHWIEWVALETKNGVQLKKLTPSDPPKAVFALAEGDQVVAAYAYCNLHGLWKA